MRAPFSSLFLAAAYLAGVGCASKPPQETEVAAASAACGNDSSNSLHLTSQSLHSVERDAAPESVLTQGDTGAVSSSAAAGGGATRALRKASISGNNGGGGNGATAPKYTPGSDNEIVARRLKKAAEQETNPALRAKLWKEYTDYVQGAAVK